MFNLWDVVKMLLLYPFNITKNSYLSIKNYSLNKEVVNHMKDLIEELELFALYLSKGPTEIRIFNMDNSPFNVHINLYFLNDSVIFFSLEREDDFISIRTGGRSAGGVKRYKIKNIDYEKLAQYLYENIENNYAKESSWKVKNSIDYFTDNQVWKEKIIYKRINDDYHTNKNWILRRLIILGSHEEKHNRYQKAMNDLMIYIQDRNVILELANEIKELYSAKTTFDKLTK